MTVIFQNHEKIYLHPNYASTATPWKLLASFFKQGLPFTNEKKRSRSVGFRPRNNAFSHSFCAFGPAGG